MIWFLSLSRSGPFTLIFQRAMFNHPNTWESLGTWSLHKSPPPLPHNYSLFQHLLDRSFTLYARPHKTSCRSHRTYSLYITFHRGPSKRFLHVLRHMDLTCNTTLHMATLWQLPILALSSTKPKQTWQTQATIASSSLATKSKNHLHNVISDSIYAGTFIS